MPAQRDSQWNEMAQVLLPEASLKDRLISLTICMFIEWANLIKAKVKSSEIVKLLPAK